MRRLSVFLIVLAMFLALPLAANAQDDSFEVDIHTTGSMVHQNADGCDLSTGEFYIEADGVIIETGRTRLVSCANEDASLVRYRVAYRDASTGNLVTAIGRAELIDADFDAGVLTYALTERIVSSTTGITGHATGTGVVVLTDAGFDVSSWNHWTIYP